MESADPCEKCGRQPQWTRDEPFDCNEPFCFDCRRTFCEAAIVERGMTRLLGRGRVTEDDLVEESEAVVADLVAFSDKVTLFRRDEQDRTRQ